MSAADPIRAAREAGARALCCGPRGCHFERKPEREIAVWPGEHTTCVVGPSQRERAAITVAAFLRHPGLSAALHDLMQRPENAGRPWAEVLAEAVESAGGER